jgi:DnaA family protein
MMRQLILNLDHRATPTLAGFVTGRNAEAVALLRTLQGDHAAARVPGSDQRCVYLWGAPGAGKSHLLRALGSQPGSRYLDAALAATTPAALAHDRQVRLYLLDNCERLDAAAQIAAFALFNQVREHAGVLVAAAAVPPALLQVREDLRTRLAWGLTYQLHELSDDEKIHALTGAAEARALRLSAGVLPYLITHFRRDMRSLTAMLDALDRYSLETQRPITLPLLRSLLQQQGEPTA